MAWLARNWFWVLIAIAFIAMHGFGHGHGFHGGHSGNDSQQTMDQKDNDAAQGRAATTKSGGHQH